MTDRVCGWGILGAANIARKNWQAMRHAENATLVAVASRDRARSQQFIDDCQSEVPFPQPPQAMGSYEELLARDDIDAVYIPLPTGIRKSWVIRAAEAGKHILAEKPSAVHARDLEEMLAACREHNVQYMDGVMFMHSARLPRMRELLDDGHSIGQMKRIVSQFSFLGEEQFVRENIRVHSQLEPAGALGDLGWYNIRFTLWAMNWQMPERVSGRLLSEASRGDSPDRVPTEFSAELFFPRGVSASFYCSFVTQNQQWANISGTRGYLHVRDFVLPRFGSELTFDVTQLEFRVTGCDFNMEDHTRHHAVREYSNSFANAQETNMIRRFSELALSGKPDAFWARVALQTQRVLDACLESARAGGKTIEVGGRGRED